MTEKLPAKQITKAQARKATDRVKVAIVDAWRLLTEAHDMGAWSVLGYESFGVYAEAEFDMSPGNAYRLVTQGHVVAAMEEATQSELPPGSVSTREANDLKRRLDEVLAALQAATVGKSDADRLQAIQEELVRLREERAKEKAEAKRRKEEEDAERRAKEEEDSRARESTDDESAGEATAKAQADAKTKDAGTTSTPTSKAAQVVAVLPKVCAVPVAEVVAELGGPGPKASKVAKKLREWVYALERAAQGYPANGKEIIKPGDCKHPITRRMDGNCMVCLTKVGGK